MYLNSDAHFSKVPSVGIERSRFDRSHSFKFSGNVGDLIPIYVDADILPGDTISVDTSKIIRFQTMITPVMDNLFADVTCWFVPHRLVWDHWKEFMGENTASAWLPAATYTTPKLVIHEKTYTDASSRPSLNTKGTILDYMGWPVEMALNRYDNSQYKINALPIRAYSLICNEWWRSENLTDPINIYKGDSDQEAVSYGTYVEDVARGGAPFKVAKTFDLFTSCLPSPQKGPDVSVEASLSNTLTNNATRSKNFEAKHAPVFQFFDSVPSYSFNDNVGGHNNTWRDNVDRFEYDKQGSHYYSADEGGSVQWNVSTESAYGPAAADVGFRQNNLWFPLENIATSIDIKDLRMAVQLQRYYERLARSGSRYTEIIQGFFNVKSPDARLQRPEYLGGNRFPIVIDQVTNTAQSSGEALGDVGAFSRTSNYHSDFTYSATEHGTLLILLCIRYEHSYCQGIPKMFKRDTRLDYYIPTFAHISEQPVDKDSIYCGATGTFGYNEAWAEGYRYSPNRCAADMRPYISGSLGAWHLADDYNVAPTLSDSWIREDKTNVDRTLTVTSAVANQFWADVYFKMAYTRPMPLYSVPGLMDHF